MPSLDVAVELAERLRLAVESLELEADGACLRVTISIGLAATRPDEPTVEAALRRADEALYASKAAGRNRVTVATEC